MLTPNAVYVPFMHRGVTLIALLSSACTVQGVCDSTRIEYCNAADVSCQGRLVDAYTWESNPIGSGWLPYRGRREYVFTFRDKTDGNRKIAGEVYEIVPYVASVPTGSDAVIASGNLAVQTPLGNGQILILNETCADYFLRVVVRAAPVADAGTD